MRRYEHITDARRREVRDDIVQRYTSGQSIRGIALDLGRSYGFVHRMLLEQDGMRLRSRGALGRRQQAEAAAGAVSDSSAASIASPVTSVLVSEEEEVDLAGESEIVTAEEDPAARGDETAEPAFAEEDPDPAEEVPAAAPDETAEPAFAEDSELADVADSSDDELFPPPALLGVVMPPPPTPLGAVAAPAVDVPLFDY